uniref:nifU-like protein 4, mitochondrial n=1 Tax=Erigeron canadensis TaxID=72917 RepID=UPI001CB9298C|nr:nifU-like protein 4, mitochondrial [Erigeron canadensis]XP_043631926.1 nifU-like protein 4, mitochondrial [Erigeron canadensis]XP_043631928.1 nifU-like protein 4, mitochondrial [Erigeron canadensis]
MNLARDEKANTIDTDRDIRDRLHLQQQNLPSFHKRLQIIISVLGIQAVAMMRGLRRLMTSSGHLGAKSRYTPRRLLYLSSSSNHQHLFSPPNFTSSPNVVPSHTSSSGLTNFITGQKRTMFIQTQSTPNPLSLMFYPGKPVMEVGSADFPNARTAMNSPLAKALFGIDEITRVFFGSDFVTVTKSDDASWDLLKPEIFAAIMDFYSSGKPLFLDSTTAASMDTAIHEDDSEIVAMIKELLETRIRPAVQDDGGDIEYIGFDPESGVVKLKMQGACSGCPSSSVTLKSGIENMLMHYVPEVKAVEQEFDDEDENGELTSQLD